MRHLASHPDLQAQLCAQTDMIVEAAEEMLRRYGFAMPPAPHRRISTWGAKTSSTWPSMPTSTVASARISRWWRQMHYQQILKRTLEFLLDLDRNANYHLGNIGAMDSLPIRWD